MGTHTNDKIWNSPKSYSSNINMIEGSPELLQLKNLWNIINSNYYQQ